MRKKSKKKLKGLDSINPKNCEEQYTEAEIGQMTEEAKTYELELLSLEESNHELDETTQVSFGHPDYVPTDSEVKRIVKDGCKSAISLKKAIFYIWQYKIYKRQPYNCVSIVAFVGKYFGLSKATFYRQLNQVLINHKVHGKFGGENYICDFHCQKLSRYSKIIEKNGESLNSFWEFISCSEPDGITSELIEKYVLLLGYSGHLMTLTEGKKLNLPLHKFVDSAIPKAVKELECELNGDKNIESSETEQEQELTSESCTDKEGELEQGSQNDLNLVTEESVDYEAEKTDEKNTPHESECIESAREIDIALLSCQGSFTKPLEKVVNLILKLTRTSKRSQALNKNDLMELQNFIDFFLNKESEG
jgi:hypothetical protein